MSRKDTDLWKCREQAQTALQAESRPLAESLKRAFDRVTEAVKYFEKFLVVDSAAARLCALITIKGHNLAQGCYSLALDGLGQESGALLRPLVECVELLEYLRVAPGAVDQALEDRLPNAGQRAKKIRGIFKPLRDHLNEHASHLAISADAMMHLVAHQNGRLRVIQAFDRHALEKNLVTLFMFLSALQQQAAVCFEWCAEGKYPASTESLLNKSKACHAAGLAVVEAVHKKRTAAIKPRSTMTVPEVCPIVCPRPAWRECDEL